MNVLSRDLRRPGQYYGEAACSSRKPFDVIRNRSSTRSFLNRGSCHGRFASGIYFASRGCLLVFLLRPSGRVLGTDPGVEKVMVFGLCVGLQYTW